MAKKAKAKSKANKSKLKEPTSNISQEIIDEQRRKKNITYYEMVLFNYFDNEKNLIKQLMAVCLLAIGLLVSVLGNTANNWWLLILWVTANILFLIVLFILIKNIRIISDLFAQYLKQADLLDENDCDAFSNAEERITEITAKLKKDDPRIFRYFYSAIIISVLFVLSANSFLSNFFVETTIPLICLP